MTGTSTIIRLSGRAGLHNSARVRQEYIQWGMVEIEYIEIEYIEIEYIESDKSTFKGGAFEIAAELHSPPYGRQYNGATKRNCITTSPAT